jgi:hypothetical protein
MVVTAEAKAAEGRAEVQLGFQLSHVSNGKHKWLRLHRRGVLPCRPGEDGEKVSVPFMA